MICVCYKQSAVTHTFPLSAISSNGNNSVTNKQRLFLFLVAFLLSLVGGFSSALFLNLLPWETGKVKQLTRCHLTNSLFSFRTLTNSHVGVLTCAHSQEFSFFLSRTHTHAQKHKHTHKNVRISHQLLVKLKSTNHCLELRLLTCTDCCLLRLATLDHIMSDMYVL